MFNRFNRIKGEVILGCSALVFMGVLIVLGYAGEARRGSQEK